MGVRNSAIAVLVIVVFVAGVWWTASQRQKVSLNPGAVAPASEAIETPISEQPTSQAAVLAEGDASGNRPGTAPNEVPPAASEAWSPSTLEFVEQADPDPALSRELESVVQRIVDAKLDRSQYEVESVKCRGNSCQILSAARSSAGGPPWPAVLGPIMRQLSEAPARNPSTGADLRPALQMVRKSPGEPGYVTMISFD